MRFEPDEYLMIKDNSEIPTGVGISPFPAVISLFFFLLITLCTFRLHVTSLPDVPRVLVYIVLSLRPIFFVRAGFAWLSYFAGRIYISSKEVIAKNLPSMMFRLVIIQREDIQKIRVKHGVFGGFFHYGTLHIKTEDRSFRFFYVKNPDAVKKYLEANKK